MISKKDIEHLARLARIDMSEKEKEKLARDLQAVLAYVKTLQEADVGDESFTHFEHLQAHMRDDAKKSDESEIVRQKNLIEAAPLKERGFIQVKNIFER